MVRHWINAGVVGLVLVLAVLSFMLFQSAVSIEADLERANSQVAAYSEARDEAMALTDQALDSLGRANGEIRKSNAVIKELVAELEQAQSDAELQFYRGVYVSCLVTARMQGRPGEGAVEYCALWTLEAMRQAAYSVEFPGEPTQVTPPDGGGLPHAEPTPVPAPKQPLDGA